jgi:hypothetical protein
MRVSGNPPIRWALPAFLAALAVGGALLLAAPAVAAVPCWQRVIDDWSADGRVDRAYPLECYERAVMYLPEDLRTYSSAEDDITRALQERRAGSLRVLSATRGASTAASASGGAGGIALVAPALAGGLLALGASVWLVRGGRRRPPTS